VHLQVKVQCTFMWSYSTPAGEGKVHLQVKVQCTCRWRYSDPAGEVPLSKFRLFVVLLTMGGVAGSVTVV